MIRLHVSEPLEAERAVAATPEQAHYLLNVMRQGAGAELLLFNGRDGEWRARLAPAGKKGAGLIPLAQTRPQTPALDLTLVVAVVKRARLETIVEKAAELGCRRVQPVWTRRTNAERLRTDRLRAIAVEASEQTGRLDVPEVAEPLPLEEVLDAWPAGRRLVFCDEGGAGGAPLEMLDRAAADGWGVLIGPEGGFAPEERTRLLGFQGVTVLSLGPRILRADTAAIAALTLVQASAGDWRQAGERLEDDR